MIIMVPRDNAESNEVLYNLQQYDPKAWESNSLYTIRKVCNYNSSQSAVYNTSYNIFTDILFPVLFFCHNIHRGMWVAGSPLF